MVIKSFNHGNPSFLPLNDYGEKLYRASAERSHAVGLAGIEVYAVALCQFHDLVAYGYFETAFDHVIKFLSVVRVLIVFLSFGQRIHLCHERVHFPSAETACQTLVFIFFSPFHAQTLVLAGEK